MTHIRHETVDDAIPSRVNGPRALSVRDQECGRYSAVSWHVVATEWNAEDLAAQSIRSIPKQDFQVFAPRIRRRIKATAERPARIETQFAFPGYLLVLWDSDAVWQRIKGVEGVAHILHQVGDTECPAEVSPGFMIRLLTACSYLGIIEDKRSDPDRLPAIAKGSEVMVTSPLLAGAKGLCEWSSEQRIALLLAETGFRVVTRRDRVERA